MKVDLKISRYTGFHIFIVINMLQAAVEMYKGNIHGVFVEGSQFLIGVLVMEILRFFVNRKQKKEKTKLEE